MYARSDEDPNAFVDTTDEEEADFAIWWAGIEKQNERADRGEYDAE